MDEKQLQKELNSIRKNMKLFDSIIGFDYEKNNKRYVTKRQVEMVKKLFEIFDSLNWQLAFNNYKELKYQVDGNPLKIRECGTPVKVKSCKENHDNTKTYFGILLGDFPLAIGHSIDNNIVTAKYTHYNPAIFIPELNDIVFGCESWWGRIKNKKDLKKLITNKVINNVWYMKILKNLYLKD
jgi:hypothetical protein